MEVPAHIRLAKRLRDDFQVGLVQADLDTLVNVNAGIAQMEFSCAGCDDGMLCSGRGTMQIKGDQAEDWLYPHQGEGSGFTASRPA